MEQKRMVRNPPIKESSAVCAKCGHKHDVKVVKAQYEAREKSFTSFFCHSCNAYNRIRITKAGLIHLTGRQSRHTGKSTTIRADRMNCPYCDGAIDREDFDFLLKKKNYRRSTCQSCYGGIIVRRTVRGFYTTAKADIKRREDTLEKGTNHFEFDPVEKKFKIKKESYYLWQKWKKLKS